MDALNRGKYSPQKPSQWHAAWLSSYEYLIQAVFGQVSLVFHHWKAFSAEVLSVGFQFFGDSYGLTRMLITSDSRQLSC